MLISVHLPKTAGTSFLAALERHFGSSLLRDFEDRPVNTGSFKRKAHALQACLRNGFPRSDLSHVKCIHGHFLPIKYILLTMASDSRYITWMRDPVERVASHYLYWTRGGIPANAGELHRRMVKEKWSLERFCLGPEVRNIYSKFLWGFPLRRFDFIGITEFYDTEIEQLSERILGVPLESRWENVNPKATPHDYIDDPELRRRIEDYHHADMAIYRHALKLRQHRTAPL